MPWSITTEVTTNRTYTLWGDLDADDLATMIDRAKADPQNDGARLDIEGDGTGVRVSFTRVDRHQRDMLPGGSPQEEKAVLYCDAEGCDAKVMTAVVRRYVPIEAIVGWYFDGYQSWLCPEHAPEDKTR